MLICCPHFCDQLAVFGDRFEQNIDHSAAAHVETEDRIFVTSRVVGESLGNAAFQHLFCTFENISLSLRRPSSGGVALSLGEDGAKPWSLRVSVGPPANGVRSVDIKADKPLKAPVTLEAIKTEPKLADMELVKLSRLSVQSVTPEQWKLVCKMGGI